MKKILTRGLSLLLVLSIVLGLAPMLRVKARAWTVNQQNIADRADFFYNTTWVCQKTVAAWRDETYFQKGETYHLPYGQPVNSGKFIGYGVELEDFLMAAADADSVFYSKQSEWMGWTSVYYATDCAAFVAMCWGTVRQDCSTLPYYSTNKGAPTVYNIHNVLQLGDALDSTTVGHVVLVSDMIYDDSGNLIRIEITEQTPPQLKRTYFTPEELAAKYAAEFYIYRYEGSVPAVPEWGYTAECSNYAAYCNIEITKEGHIMSLPCETATNGESVSIGSIAAGEKYIATRLYENTAGELWYRIDLGNKKEGYIRAENTRYLDQITTDITLSDAVYPNALVKGKTYALIGNLSARYNQLVTAYAYVYSGFGTGGTRVTGSSDYVTSNAYTLKNSNIDYNTSFGSLTTGKYTMAIGGSYKNHYVENGVIKENTGTLELDQGYFMVVSSTTNQNTCSHSYAETVVSAGTCTSPGTSVFACSKCGKVYEQAQAAPGHEFGQWVITDATCTEEGSQVRSCGLCGEVETRIVPATGHSHHAEVFEGSCQDYARRVYTCGSCGDSYTVYDEAVMSAWQEEYPQGIAAEMIETKTQYRFSQLEEIISSEKELEGYELLGPLWQANGTETLSYVKQWPTGFNTGNILYSQYNKSPLTGWEQDTEKLTVDHDSVTGYLYYHWCYQDSYFSQSTATGRYNIFHAYYSTTKPETYRVDTSDMSYCTADPGCSNTQWYFVVEVNTQSCTTWQKMYRQGRWMEFGPWGDEAITESDTVKVETRTVYRYPDANITGHQMQTTVIDATCTQDGSKIHTCELCGYSYEEAIPAAGHSYEAEVIPPSCAQNGYTVYTCTVCGDNYTGDETTAAHSYDDGIITTAPDCVTPGVKTFSCTGCGDSYIEEVPAIGHNYEAEVIPPSCSEKGYTVYTCTVCGDSYTDDETEATGHSYEAQVVAPTCTKGGYTLYTCCVCGDNHTGDETQPQHSYQSVVIAPSCDRNGYTLYTCTLCGESYTGDATSAEHRYQAVVIAPSCHRNGYTLYTCALCGDSYTADETTAEHSYQSVVVAPTCTGTGKTLHTCAGCGDSYTDNEVPALGHSFTDGSCTVCGAPEVNTNVTISPKYPSLYFEDEISITAYFAVSDEAGIALEDMGLIAWDSPQDDGTMQTAASVTSGATRHPDGLYSVRTNGIPAKNLADTVYFKIYLKLADGTYIYSKLLDYSPRQYADSILSNPGESTQLKALVVSMLNYGAAAQTYFSYRPYSLMNEGLSAESLALVNTYDPAMVDALVSPDPQKLGQFASTGTGFGRRYPGITFDSAFCIDYFFTPNQPVGSDVVLYVWSQSDYEAAAILMPDNATQALVMTGPDTYEAAVTGIVAKDIDRTIFVTAVYTDAQGQTHCSGVLNYSLGAYCVSQASLNDPIAPFAQATAVYGYYAKNFF